MFSKKISIGCLILFVAVFVCSEVYGVPALHRDVIFTQADGSTFVARPYGDEWHNGYETKDGFTILFDKGTGNWVYADRTEAGSVVGTGIVVNKGVPTMHKHLRPLLSEKLKKTQSPLFMEEPIRITAPIRPATGNQRVLTILVQFSDVTLSTTEAQWANLMFNPAVFSTVRNYFREVSYNNMDLVPASEGYGTANNGVVIVTLPYNHPNTAENTDDRNRQITRDALIAANPYVNFAAFDTNGNSYLSTDELHIVIIVAGYEAAYSTTCGPSIWAHQWSLGDTVPPPLDGVVVAAWAGYGGYTQQGEWHCDTTWNYPATIGILTHELGHDLWLPDEYDTDLSSEGIGEWGLMGSGAWNTCIGGNLGNCPSHPAAWDKWYLEWLTPVQITGTQTVNIPDITTNPVVYQLRDNPNSVDWSFDVTSGTGEYFLVENRQLTGYNAGLPGDGLLIWHIWEGASQWNDANQNEAGRRLIDLREADGFNDLDLGTNRGDAGDPFPGTSNNTVWDDASNPSSRLYCSSGIGFCDPSGVSVTGISASGPTMTATITEQLLPPPAVTCSFTIYNPPPPPPPPPPIRIFRGGLLRFWANVTNNTGAPQTFQAATFVTLPPNGTGSKYPSSGYLLGPITITNLGAGLSINQYMTQFIPYNAPLGTYTYHGYVGTVTPPLLYDECTFDFTVIP